MTTIASVIRTGIEAGKTTDMILEDVKAAFPESNTSRACVAYYRSKMKKSDAPAATAKKAAKKAATTLPATTTAAQYTVKGIKTFNGMEGQGFNATLYRNGKKVAEVVDDASGGEMMFYWVDTATNAPRDAFDYKGTPSVIKMTNEEWDLYSFCRTLPKCSVGVTDAKGDDMTVDMCPAIFVDELINEAELRRTLARLTKGKVAFSQGGKLYTIKVEPTAKNIETVKAKNVGAVILNELSEAEALEVLRKV